ncbi:DNA polymerase epsilon subunit D [Colletotrichum lupini]|uniref:DNA polymerase epsilon subunit D n=1 Tax=Colletotrichum lupini TaxID=145971 RepID=A0A9Q8T0C0_9PEZI|nr:DNA polymerase epsilon subunit D [Colletotrichum lupini]UQC86924.1 DNA polymerase epsilon subunit D [Colletotrichum lupini]
MPPRKSDASRRSDISNARFIVMDEEPSTSTTPAKAAAAPATAANAAAAKSTPATTEKKESQTHDKMAKADRDALTIEDLSLPKSIITRLAKGVLPPQTQIQANAVLAMGKSATVFINYLASHANEITTNAGKKTVSAEDVFKALDDIEFGFLREPLEQEFTKYTQIQNAKRTNYRNKVAAKKGGAAAGAAGTASADASLLSNPDDSVMTAASTDTAPRSKKARVDDSAMTVDEEAEDAETEPEEEAEEEEDEEADEEEEEEDDDEDEEGSSEEMHDALETKEGEGSDVDEALDGDESD